MGGMWVEVGVAGPKGAAWCEWEIPTSNEGSWQERVLLWWLRGEIFWAWWLCLEAAAMPRPGASSLPLVLDGQGDAGQGLGADVRANAAKWARLPPISIRASWARAASPAWSGWYSGSKAGPSIAPSSRAQPRCRPPRCRQLQGARAGRCGAERCLCRLGCHLGLGIGCGFLGVMRRPKAAGPRGPPLCKKTRIRCHCVFDLLAPVIS